MTVGQVVVHSRCQSVHTERSGRELSTRISSGGRRCACRASQSLTIHIYTYPPIQQQQQEVECNGTKCSHWWDRRQMGIPIILCTCLFTLGGANQSVLMLDMSLGRDNKWTANKSRDWMTDKDGSLFVTYLHLASLCWIFIKLHKFIRNKYTLRPPHWNPPLNWNSL